MKTVIAFAARLTNKFNLIPLTVALAAIHGMISIFGVGGTFNILRKVRKQHGKAMVSGVRQGSRSISRRTEVSNVPSEPTRDLRKGPPRTSVEETTSETREGI